MTTERVLPEIAVRPQAPAVDGQRPYQARPRPRVWPAADWRSSVGVPGASARADRKTVSPKAKAAGLAKPRGEALLSTTTRAGMLIGVSAAVYAVSLATVSGLEARTQAELVAQNRPAIDALNQARAANDALAASIQDADAQVRALADQYNAVGQDMTAYQARFDSLAALVAKIEGSAAALNTTISLPSVSIHGAIGGGARTTVVTTTSGSGKP